MAKLRVDKIAAPIVKDEFTGSVHFDGTGDYLSIPSSSDFALGDNDWTIEYFAYPTSTTQYQRHFYLVGSTANQIEGIFADSSGISFGKTNVFAPTQVTHPINQWNHYALVHDSTNMRLYLNGVSVATSSSNFTDENKSLHIGYSNSTFGGYFTGNISNFRILKGVALYTANFTSPQIPDRELEVLDDRTVFLACQSPTDATAEATGRHTITANANAVAATANPGLPRRIGGTNTYSTITENTGSVFFDGTGDYIKSSIDSEDFAFSGDFAMECWVQKSGNGAHADGIGNVIMMTGNTNNRNGIWISVTNAGSLIAKVAYDTSSWALEISGGTLSNGVWHHVALTRSGSTVRLFLDGVQQASGSNSTDITTTYSNAFSVGGQFNPAGSRHINGYVSNARICKGHPVYTSNFIPPTRELEVHPGPDDDRTVVLTCYDGENIFADKTGRHIIAAYGDRTSSPTPAATDSPIGITTVAPVTRNVDPTAGPTFQGGAGYTSQNWLTLPKGTTIERMPVLGGVNATSARGVFGGGYSTSDIEYIQISTLGNSSEFGDRAHANLARPAALSSSTRGLFAGGFTPNTYSNTIDYITISSTGNGKDFGDMMDALWARTGCSNSVRGIIAGGSDGSNTNLIEHLTISSTGNGHDFGDLTRARRELGGSSSTTRGIFMGGRSPVPSGQDNDENIIDYITIATTGNAVDFGDLTVGARTAGASCSNATRSLYSGGNSSNTIEFVTIATLGNSTNFGDMNNALNRLGSCASSTRGIIAGGSPTNNTIEYVTISTESGAIDFGDLSAGAKRDIAGLSNAHGGLG